MRNKLVQLQNNPIINHRNFSLENIEQLEQHKLNKLFKLHIKKYKKKAKHFSFTRNIFVAE